MLDETSQPFRPMARVLQLLGDELIGSVRLAELYVWHHCFAEYTSKEAYLSELFP